MTGAVVLAAALAPLLVGPLVGCVLLAARLERVARAAHDLRAPLTAARLALHAAGRDRGWVALAPVDHELARAAIALDDLESARRGLAPRLRAQPVEAHALLGDVLASWAPLAWPTGRGLRIERDEEAGGAPRADLASRPLVVLGDRARLAQALGNLVGNALEHGTGTVVLRARAGSHRPDRVRFEVEDAGPGLPASVRALARRRWAGRGGRGRGLSIAAEVADRHGGAVHDERIAGGCRLVLELPAAPPAATPPIGPVAAPPGEPASAGPGGDPLAGLRLGGTARPRGPR